VFRARERGFKQFKCPVRNVLSNIAVRNSMLFTKIFSHYLIIEHTLARVTAQSKIGLHYCYNAHTLLHTTLLTITSRTGEPDRDLHDANVNQLSIRREEDTQPSAQCCVITNKNCII
jgi:hypothetical protein